MWDYGNFNFYVNTIFVSDVHVLANQEWNSEWAMDIFTKPGCHAKDALLCCSLQTYESNQIASLTRDAFKIIK